MNTRERGVKGKGKVDEEIGRKVQENGKETGSKIRIHDSRQEKNRVAGGELQKLIAFRLEPKETITKTATIITTITTTTKSTTTTTTKITSTTKTTTMRTRTAATTPKAAFTQAHTFAYYYHYIGRLSGFQHIAVFFSC